MLQGHYPVDIRKLAKDAASVHCLGDLPRGRGGTVYGCQDAEIVSRTEATIGTGKTLKVSLVCIGDRVDRPDVAAKRIVTIEVTHAAIVVMDMRAGQYVAGGEADDLTVFANRITVGNWRSCDFMTSRNFVPCSDPDTNVRTDIQRGGGKKGLPHYHSPFGSTRAPTPPSGLSSLCLPVTDQ